MSYETALRCFDENVKLIGTPGPGNHPAYLEYNLNKGLANLAEHLARELVTIHQRLDIIQRNQERR